MPFEYRKLRGRIIEKYGSQDKFAEAIGTTSVTVSKKMTGKVQFSQDDMILWCEALDIPLTEAGPYFFS